MVDRKYGWKKQKADPRDHIYRAPAIAAIALPKVVDLRKYDSPIEDQGGIGACTAHAVSGALQLLEIKKRAPSIGVLLWCKNLFLGIWRAVSAFFANRPFVYSKNLSRLFIYYNARVLEGTSDYDSGAEIRDGVKVVAQQGACLEKDWNYNNSYLIKPTDNCYKDALPHLLTEYKAITTLDDMRGCLASGFPFIFGMIVYDSFESPQVQKTGIVNMPQPNEGVKGGHAVMAVGYNDDTQRFLCRNSWGSSWGQGGYFTIPYQYVSDPTLATDFWMLRR